MRVGEANMREYIRRFGFGQKTGIPNCRPNRLDASARCAACGAPRRWHSVSMGQEISVTTTMQLAQACSVSRQRRAFW